MYSCHDSEYADDPLSFTILRSYLQSLRYYHLHLYVLYTIFSL